MERQCESLRNWVVVSPGVGFTGVRDVEIKLPVMLGLTVRPGKWRKIFRYSLIHTSFVNNLSLLPDVCFEGVVGVEAWYLLTVRPVNKTLLQL